MIVRIYLLAWVLLGVGCGKTAERAERQIRKTHVREVRHWVERNVVRHRKGVSLAAKRLAPGFLVEPATTRSAQMRTALRLMSQPPRGVSELIASPKSFLAATDDKGVVMARDVVPEQDRMQGQDLHTFEPVHEALSGQAAEGVVVFPSLGQGESSVSVIFAHPVFADNHVVGTILLGIPFWRLAQQLSQQLRLTYASQTDLVLWVYLLHEGRLHHFGTPPEVDHALPSPPKITRTLAAHPGGYTAQMTLANRPYAYGVYPLEDLFRGSSVIIVRSDPL
ncbi:MAG: hypothetical protein H6715_03970 [Myxococcales bacterium]|nr:hypothetical protein [Myxococcales bacterium]MCB9708640.1 hypothetical protein [Myxococcales bacterium]